MTLFRYYDIILSVKSTFLQVFRYILPMQPGGIMTLTQEQPMLEEVLHRCVVKEDGSFTIYTYDVFWQMPNMRPITNENSPGIKFCPFCGKSLGEPSNISQLAYVIIRGALEARVNQHSELPGPYVIQLITDVLQELGKSIQITVIE